MYRIVFIALTIAALFTGCGRTQAIEEMVQQRQERAATSTCSHAAEPSNTPDPCPVHPLEVFEEINRIRALHGLPAIAYNAELEPGAFIRAGEASVDFSHYRPDGSPCTSVSELADGEIIFDALAIEGIDAAIIVDTWMNSPPHREAVLRNDRAMEMGAGYYLDWEENTTTWSVLFHLI